MYLKHSLVTSYYPDFLTEKVAEQTRDLLEFLGYESYVEPHDKLRSVKLFINNEYKAQVVEGCNSASVIILFVSFVTAFYNGFFKTMLYCFFGVFLLYVVNVFRIAVLAIAFYYYPSYSGFLHDVLFPLMIYGVVFVFWVFWVKQFSHKSKN